MKNKELRKKQITKKIKEAVFFKGKENLDMIVMAQRNTTSEDFKVVCVLGENQFFDKRRCENLTNGLALTFCISDIIEMHHLPESLEEYVDIVIELIESEERRG